uniref:Uncharacterized protein n=1 Tax=Ulva partita TaxID=1605170 RepID=A0A1C9ZWF1_9CHLO|nr:hypothetical protein [Ulva partita]
MTPAYVHLSRTTEVQLLQVLGCCQGQSTPRRSSRMIRLSWHAGSHFPHPFSYLLSWSEIT